MLSQMAMAHIYKVYSIIYNVYNILSLTFILIKYVSNHITQAVDSICYYGVMLNINFMYFKLHIINEILLFQPVK